MDGKRTRSFKEKRGGLSKIACLSSSGACFCAFTVHILRMPIEQAYAHTRVNMSCLKTWRGTTVHPTSGAPWCLAAAELSLLK